MANKGKGRVAIVDGVRTPFQKQLTGLKGVSALTMGQWVVNELFIRSELPNEAIEQLVFGQVIQMPKVPNIAREIVLATQLDNCTDAYSVTKACATSFQSVANISQSIIAGQIAIGIAGGADSCSVLPIQLSEPFAESLLVASKARSVLKKIAAFNALRFPHLLPQAPAIAEYSTGLTMGQSAEQMAKSYAISRQDQEAYALQSHHRVEQAWAEGHLSNEVIRCHPGKKNQAVDIDNCFRKPEQLQNLARLKPVFDRRHGTITSATSSPLTDGAAAILLMSESRALAHHQAPLAYIHAFAFSASEVKQDMLAGPAHAISRLLQQTGMTLAQMDLIEMHEAFAAQVLVNLQLLESRKFAARYGYKCAVGSVDMDKFNVLGGSLAFGHPFAATGARMLMQTARELKRRNGQFALVSTCAAGGIGAAFILEAAK